MPMIKTENLTYTYSKGTPFEKTAVDNISIEIEQGEFVGVIGHTGSGKSTFIQHLNGLLQPTSGKVTIDGEEMWKDKARLRAIRFKVGLVFQYPEYQLFEETVYKDIAFGPTNMGLSKEEIDTRIRETARLVDLDEALFERSPFELSGGQRRRVAIAGVMAMNPQVLILDEPTAGLDPKGRDMILEQIARYHKERGGTVLLVSHSMEDIARYANKALVMNKSRLFMYDDTETVFAHSQELSQMGLSVPQVSRIFLALSGKGYPVKEGVFTMRQAKDELLSALSGREG